MTPLSTEEEFAAVHALLHLIEVRLELLDEAVRLGASALLSEAVLDTRSLRREMSERLQQLQAQLDAVTADAKPREAVAAARATPARST